jgi:folate-binding protein YgfZ
MSMNLSSFPVLELNGPDAVAFAQAQFSNDVAVLGDGRWQWNAWLNPQGRVRAFFALLRLDAQHLRLILRGGDAVALADALRRYVFRSKVTIQVADGAASVVDDVSALGFEAPSGDAIARNGDASAIAMPGGKRWLVAGATPANAVATDRSMLADIRDGIPLITPPLVEEALPHWLGLLRLGAVSVKKGCYPGQEITSRLHFKGGNKRSLYRVTFDAAIAPDSGAGVFAENGERVGQIVMACDGEALAIVAHASADQALRFESSTPLRVRERFD